MVPRFPLSRNGKEWRGAASTTPKWRGTFSLIHPVLRKRTTQALTSPERSIDLAPCRLGGIVTSQEKSRVLREGREKEREREKRKKNVALVTIPFAAAVTSGGRNITSTARPDRPGRIVAPLVPRTRGFTGCRVAVDVAAGWFA